MMSRTGQFSPVVKDGSLLSAVSSKQVPDVALLDGENFEKSKELSPLETELLNNATALLGLCNR